MARITHSALIATALLVAGCLPHVEDLKKEKQWCSGNVVTLEQMRSSCTALIQAGRLNSDDLAWAYSRRGQANILLHQSARAIQDYDEVIRLKPNDADGYIMRSVVEKHLGNSAGAKADLAKACALDPKRSCL
jgi:Flp pilus assembly protein TadD